MLFLDQRRDEFVSKFLKFVRYGGYHTRQQADGRPQYYRFTAPANNEYPFMLELFSALPSDVNYLGEGHLVPIPTLSPYVSWAFCYVTVGDLGRPT